VSRLALALALIAGSGCEELGNLGNPPGGIYGPSGGAQQGDLVGEVQRVDTRLQQIELRTQDGRTAVVGYDSRTRVTYRGEEYSVADLEPGDLVGMEIQQNSRGNYYTNLIRVRQSVQERGGTSAPRAPVQQLEGTVGKVDYERGFFELRDPYSGTVVVSLPYNPRRSIADRFRQIRSGDNVRVEGRFLNRDRFELEEFL